MSAAPTDSPRLIETPDAASELRLGERAFRAVADPSLRGRNHRTCFKCDYSLAGLSVTDACPECGYPVPTVGAFVLVGPLIALLLHIRLLGRVRGLLKAAEAQWAAKASTELIPPLTAATAQPA